MCRALVRHVCRAHMFALDLESVCVRVPVIVTVQ